MSSEDREDDTIYKVVVNHEEQYSIWPAERELPLGWKEAGKQGPKAECLDYIKEVWTDMRPLSLRKKMEEAAQGNGGQERVTIARGSRLCPQQRHRAQARSYNFAESSRRICRSALARDASAAFPRRYCGGA